MESITEEIKKERQENVDEYNRVKSHKDKMYMLDNIDLCDREIRRHKETCKEIYEDNLKSLKQLKFYHSISNQKRKLPYLIKYNKGWIDCLELQNKWLKREMEE